MSNQSSIESNAWNVVKPNAWNVVEPKKKSTNNLEKKVLINNDELLIDIKPIFDEKWIFTNIINPASTLINDAYISNKNILYEKVLGPFQNTFILSAKFKTMLKEIIEKKYNFQVWIKTRADTNKGYYNLRIECFERRLPLISQSSLVVSPVLDTESYSSFPKLSNKEIKENVNNLSWKKAVMQIDL